MDNLRDNDLVSTGWHVLRFNGRQVFTKMDDYRLLKVQKTINHFGGIDYEGVLPRGFHKRVGRTEPLLTIFEAPDREYETSKVQPKDLD